MFTRHTTHPPSVQTPNMFRVKVLLFYSTLVWYIHITEVVTMENNIRYIKYVITFIALSDS